MFVPIKATYSSGTVQDSHLIPFSSLDSEPIDDAKLQKVEGKTKEKALFFTQMEFFVIFITMLHTVPSVSWQA